MAIADDHDGSGVGEVAEEASARAAGGAGEDRGGELVGVVQRGAGAARRPAVALSEPERRLLDDLFAFVSEHAADSGLEIDRERVREAVAYAC